MAERLRQFTNLSSWTDDDYTIKGGEVLTVDFLHSSPNQFVIQNDNNAKLHVSISKIPTLTNYEFVVDKNEYGIFGRPTPTRKLYIFNTSTETVTIKLFSVYETFDLNILKKTNVSMGNVALSTDGIVRGFQSGVSLPSGTNNIGSVSIDDEDLILFQTMGEDIDDINGNVGEMKTSIASNLDNTNQIVTLLEAISESGIGGGTGSDAALESRKLYVMGDCYDKTPVYQNGVSEFTYAASSKEKIHFNYLINDGEDAQIKVNDNTIFTLYGGENLTDFEVELNSGDVITIVDGTYRIKYFTY